jgi:hypothetical protein
MVVFNTIFVFSFSLIQPYFCLERQYAKLETFSSLESLACKGSWGDKILANEKRENFGKAIILPIKTGRRTR